MRASPKAFPQKPGLATRLEVRLAYIPDLGLGYKVCRPGSWKSVGMHTTDLAVARDMADLS